MAKKTSPEKLAVHKVYATLSLITVVLLVVLAGLLTWTSNFTTGMVHDELAAQKIYFPEKGSPAFDPETYPDLQKYAGELVDTGEEAKAYANGYIGRHLKEIAGGKVYSEVSTEARKDPTNQTLQAQKQQLFMGETLRGILLGTGYAYGTIGKIADIASKVMFAGAALMAVSYLYFSEKLRSSK